MSSLFCIGGYLVFLSNENNEPIHVHIVKGKPSPNYNEGMAYPGRPMYRCQQRQQDPAK